MTTDNSKPRIEELDELAILPRCDKDIRILERDSEFLIIEKPSGLLSVPGRHPANRDSVLIRLQQEFPTTAIVHRLDFDTSGIMVIPLNKHALSHVSKQFQARHVRKTYTAIVDGFVQQDEGVIDLPIAADEKNRPKYKICFSAGKKSVTEFSVFSRDEKTQSTRLMLHPVTGRSHQLRLHLQAIGHPIWGCVFYANEEIRKKADRLLLHATEIEFDHPVTQQRIQFVSKPDF